MLFSPWFYDFKRTVSSKTTIIAASTIVLLEISDAYVTFVDDSGYITSGGASNNLIGGTVRSDVFANTAFNMMGFGLLISLLVILGGLGVFGNDKLRGVLESVLAKPVSRRGLVLSRYTSIFCAIGTATIVSFFAIDLMFYFLTGATFSVIFDLVFVFSFLSQIASVLALVFIITYFVKSLAVLIGVVIGLWVFFGLFWDYAVGTIASLVGASAGNGAAFSAGFISANIDSYFVNPFLGLGSLAFVYTIQWYELNTPISSAQYGVSLFSLGITEAIWVIVPLTFLMWIATRRD